MNATDLLFAPILSAESERKLRELVEKIMTNPADDHLTTSIANQIVDLLEQNGITDEKEIIDAVHRTVKDLGGNLAPAVAFLFGVAHICLRHLTGHAHRRP